MIGVLDAQGRIAQVVASLDGVEAPHGTVAYVPPGFLSGALRWDGAGFVDDLAWVEARVLHAIDATAEALVTAAVAVTPVLQEFRAEKRRELERWQAAGEARVVTAEAYPFIVAEADARGMTAAEIAGEIAAAVAQWLAAGSQVEALRVAGRADVRAAATAAEKRAAGEAAIAALLALAG